MSQVHWLGAGLSTWPGIEKLANSDIQLIVWNRSVDKAQQAIAGTTGAIEGRAAAQTLDWQTLEDTVSAGDVVVSMLPGDFHVKVAKLCLTKQAHFVSSSYISPEMQALHADALKNNLVFLNEVGLDPGIDHLFAHLLIDDYQTSDAYHLKNKLSFRSYCGGVPAVPNDFKYKFSWSPFGVLKALTSPAQWIEHGDVQTIATPWKAIRDYSVNLGDGNEESFEAYPNRDSLPFLSAYHFEDNWTVEQFVRGTLRLSGWSDAWASLFNEIENMSEEQRTPRLTEISEQLWQQHAYQDGEADRVVLMVDLEAHNEKGDVVWHQSRSIDNSGNEHSSSMARLVSHTVSLGVQSVLNGELQAGVMAAPSERAIVERWLNELSELNSGFAHQVHA